MEKIIFTDPDTGEETPFYVLEQTCIAGITYLLVTEEEEEDSDAYILREARTEGDDIIYEVVEDEEELRALSKVFMELLEDIDIEV